MQNVVVMPGVYNELEISLEWVRPDFSSADSKAMNYHEFLEREGMVIEKDKAEHVFRQGDSTV